MTRAMTEHLCEMQLGYHAVKSVSHPYFGDEIFTEEREEIMHSVRMRHQEATHDLTDADSTGPPVVTGNPEIDQLLEELDLQVADIASPLDPAGESVSGVPEEASGRASTEGGAV